LEEPLLYNLHMVWYSPKSKSICNWWSVCQSFIAPSPLWDSLPKFSKCVTSDHYGVSSHGAPDDRTSLSEFINCLCL